MNEHSKFSILQPGYIAVGLLCKSHICLWQPWRIVDKIGGLKIREAGFEVRSIAVL